MLNNINADTEHRLRTQNYLGSEFFLKRLLTQIIDTSTPETGNYVIGKVVGKSLIIGYLFTLTKNSVVLIFVLVLLIIMFICIKVISKTLKQKKIQDNHSHDYPVISFFPQNKKNKFRHISQ